VIVVGSTFIIPGELAAKPGCIDIADERDRPPRAPSADPEAWREKLRAWVLSLPRPRTTEEP
jgi:hypothetical protein